VATFDERMSEFITDRLPRPDLVVEILCVDHCGTYAVPFPCRHSDGTWRNGATGVILTASVVGWREWDLRNPSAEKPSSRDT
jgi:hypothetical protein